LDVLLPIWKRKSEGRKKVGKRKCTELSKQNKKRKYWVETILWE